MEPLCCVAPDAAHTRRGTTHSPFKGVSYDASVRRWRVRITVAGRQVHVGRYNTEAQAAHAYDRASLHLLGPQSELNFSAEEALNDPTPLSGSLLTLLCNPKYPHVVPLPGGTLVDPAAAWANAGACAVASRKRARDADVDAMWPAAFDGEAMMTDPCTGTLPDDADWLLPDELIMQDLAEAGMLSPHSSADTQLPLALGNLDMAALFADDDLLQPDQAQQLHTGFGPMDQQVLTPQAPTAYEAAPGPFAMAPTGAPSMLQQHAAAHGGAAGVQQLVQASALMVNGPMNAASALAAAAFSAAQYAQDAAPPPPLGPPCDADVALLSQLLLDLLARPGALVADGKDSVRGIIIAGCLPSVGSMGAFRVQLTLNVERI